jgi:hypothetical protein
MPPRGKYPDFPRPLAVMTWPSDPISRDAHSNGMTLAKVERSANPKWGTGVVLDCSISARNPSPNFLMNSPPLDTGLAVRRRRLVNLRNARNRVETAPVFHTSGCVIRPETRSLYRKHMKGAPEKYWTYTGVGNKI